MTEVIDAMGRWILSHATCRFCGRPSWDHFPEGVVADRYRCAYCGRTQSEEQAPEYVTHENLLKQLPCLICGVPIDPAWTVAFEFDGEKFKGIKHAYDCSQAVPGF